MANDYPNLTPEEKAELGRFFDTLHEAWKKVDRTKPRGAKERTDTFLGVLRELYPDNNIPDVVRNEFRSYKVTQSRLPKKKEGST